MKFNTICEIPKGSKNKYEYDEELKAIKLDFVFKDGFSYPFNYGMIPQTKGGDGDCLDVIILTPFPIEPGIVVECRPIGMIELLDRGQEDNKILAVPVTDETTNYQSIKDLPDNQIEEFKKFFKDVAIQKNKIIEIRGFHDKDSAVEELNRCKN